MKSDDHSLFGVYNPCDLRQLAHSKSQVSKLGLSFKLSCFGFVCLFNIDLQIPNL